MRSFYTAIGPISAVVLSSLFFAYKHFKVPDCVWDKLPGGGSATWDMGFFVAWYDTVGIAYEFGFARFGGFCAFCTSEPNPCGRASASTRESYSA